MTVAASNNIFKEIWVVGAFDRHNYGDLLFPLLVRHAARSRGFLGPIHYFSTRKSDLSKFGAVPTEKLSSIFGGRDASGAIVVVAGGEVLAATWKIILSYLYPRAVILAVKGISSLFSEAGANSIFSKLLGVPSKMPFVYEPSDFEGDPKVVYNAVGGSHLQYQSESVKAIVADKLKNSTFVSVRDSSSKNLLEQLGVRNVALSPDSAVLLSDMFPTSQLRKLASADTISNIDSISGGYVCFQSAHMHIQGREAVVADSILKTIEKTDLDVVLLVIGMAAGHSDDEAARVLMEKIGPHPRIHLMDTGSIYDIVLTISMAKMYAGTSLHGAITSLSYSVPQLGLCPKSVTKLAAFLDTWSEGSVSGLCDYPEMPQFCQRLMSASKDVLDFHRQRAIQAAMANFDRMLLI